MKGSVNERRDITSRFWDIILRDDKLTWWHHNVNKMRFEFYVVIWRSKINGVICWHVYMTFTRRWHDAQGLRR